MKRTMTIISATILSAALFILGFASPSSQRRSDQGFVPPGPEQDAAGAAQFVQPRIGSCTASNIGGRYGVMIQGSAPALGPLPLASVGTVVMDGGTLSGSDSLSLGGQIIPRTFTGTYTVTPDCSVSVTITVQTGTPGLVVNLKGVAVNGGQEAIFVETDPGTIITGTAKRIF